MAPGSAGLAARNFFAADFTLAWVLLSAADNSGISYCFDRASAGFYPQHISCHTRDIHTISVFAQLYYIGENLSARHYPATIMMALFLLPSIYTAQYGLMALLCYLQFVFVPTFSLFGVAIDHAIPTAPKGNSDLMYAPQAGSRKYRVSYELPKFRKEESGEQSKAADHFVWAAEGESMFAIARSVNTKTYFGMFFEDIQTIIFSESIAREGIKDLLDFWQRDAEMRRRVNLFVTPGRAEEILKAESVVKEVNSVFIAKITRNVDRSPYFASKTELGQVSKALRLKRSFSPQ